MDISNIKTIVFSPTGTSKKIAQAIAEGAQESQTVEYIDLTSPNHPRNISVADNELAIIAVPVYAGRVAPLAEQRLREISGNNSPAIIVALYGNREFDDALVELKDIALAQSLSIVAAASFVGEHSFSSTTFPTSHGRPDASDLKIAKEFGEKAMSQLLADTQPAEINVPGNTPYKDGMKNLPFTPAINLEQCTQCEECVTACPAGAISLKTEIQIDAELCTFCCACIKVCPEECFSLTSTPMEEKAVALHTNCKERKEPQLFM
ncbi:MAG: ferredoxin [Desulforhopalus sp.]|jgi:ferredoxin